MVEKLKSILRPIPWSLVLRVFAFGVGWLLLPFWVFVFLALYFYFFPFFQPLKLILHFVILLFFMAVIPPSFLSAVFFSVLFYILLGLKDFIFIERAPAHEMLFLLFILLLSTQFYFSIDAHYGMAALFYSFLAFAIFFLLGRSAFLGRQAIPPDNGISDRALVFLFVLSFLLCQFLLATSALPLNFLYQAAIFFLSAAVLIESVFDYSFGTLTSRRLLANFSVFLVFIVLILGSVPWGL